MAAVAACGDTAEGGACGDDQLSYGSVGKPFLDRYCVSCHGGDVVGSARQGAPPTRVFDTLVQVKAHAQAIHSAVVVTKVMPFGPSARKPTQAEREQFGAWLDCDAPE